MYDRDEHHRVYKGWFIAKNKTVYKWFVRTPDVLNVLT